jgi:transglutaminase-like putative cysteine protease
MELTAVLCCCPQPKSPCAPQEHLFKSFAACIYHLTRYRYDRPVTLGPQNIRLRPAPRLRTRVIQHSLKVSPENHLVNYPQDAHGNWPTRLKFPKPAIEPKIEAGLVTDMFVENPFDFFAEEAASKFSLSTVRKPRPTSESVCSTSLLAHCCRNS